MLRAAAIAIVLAAGFVGSAPAQEAGQHPNQPAAVPHGAGDGQENWRVVVVTGPVQARAAQGDWAAVVEGQEFAERTHLEIGESGQLLLFNGRDTIAVSPGAVLVLPDPSAADGVTSVRQDAGSAHYDIESRHSSGPPLWDAGATGGAASIDAAPVERFEVETPYLAAIVKGTTFSVTVTSDRASVSVQDGVVAVRDSETGDTEDVVAGRTGTSGPAAALRVMESAAVLRDIRRGVGPDLETTVGDNGQGNSDHGHGNGGGNGGGNGRGNGGGRDAERGCNGNGNCDHDRH